MKAPSQTAQVVFATLLVTLVSCGAKKTPERITVHLRNSYSGPLHLRACVAEAKDPAVPGAGGVADIADCPIGDVEVEIVMPKGTVLFPSEKVQLIKTGDGLPAQITVVIP